MKSSLERLQPTQKVSYQILVIGSTLAVLMSFAAETLWDLHPCRLCLAQRTLYFALVAFGSTQIMSKTRWSQKMCLITLFALICVSGYHGMVQLSIVNDRCQNNEKIEDARSLLAALEKPTSCVNTSWRFLNIPASIWNVGIAFGFLVLLNLKDKTRKKT